MPNKNRESIYERFKAAVDKFFERKRQLNEGQEREYEANLEQKRAILKDLEEKAKAKEGTEAHILDSVEQWNTIGFVPRKAMDTLAKDVARIVDSYLDSLAGTMNPTDLIKLKVNVHAKITSRGHSRPERGERYDRGDRQDRNDRGDRGNFRKGGSAPRNDDNSLRGMERNLRTRIQQLENQIHSYENNLSFFANSRNAESLRKDVEGKVKLLSKDLQDVKDQLKIVQQGIAEEQKDK